MMRDMEDKVIVMTGAASGIGRAAAELAARRGAKVVVADIAEEQGEKVVEVIRGEGGTATFLRTDVTSEDDIRRMVDHAVDTYGQLDGAFNNAGMPPTSRPLHEVTHAEWQRHIAVNLTSVFLCMKYEIPAMLEKRKGSIVNTASAAAVRGNIGFSEYIAAKHGVLGLGRAAGVEYGSAGIRVNTVLPGAIKTPMLQEAMDLGLNAFSGTKYPMQRPGEPSELGEAVVWLLSDAASYVTAAHLAVDGGSTAT
jgi:2,5-dichloro-2,5-cyclohexadiene-1,4-diol dehydrogenase 1